MIELISYNILNGKKLNDILAWIKKANPMPDVVCFQEFPESKLEEVREKLVNTPYAFEFAPAFKKKKVMYGELTAFRKDNLKLVQSEVVELGLSKLDSAIFRHKSHKSSLITTFKHGRRVFSIANVHLVIFALHKSRKKQLAKIIGMMDKKVPAIIVGDYNYSKFFGRKRGLINFMQDFGYKMAGERVITHRLWKFPQQIDYAFYKDIKIMETKVGRVKYSDHFPILIKFKV